MKKHHILPIATVSVAGLLWLLFRRYDDRHTPWAEIRMNRAGEPSD